MYFLVKKMKNLRSKRTNEGLTQWSSGQDSGLPCQGAQVPPLAQRARGFPAGSDSKSVCLQCGRPRFDPWVGMLPWRRKWQCTPVFLPGESHGWRSRVGDSPGGCNESDRTEGFHFHFLGELRSHRLCGEGKNINQ